VRRSAAQAEKAARLLESARRQREQLERRLEASETAHERARMQLAAQDAELRAAAAEAADDAQRVSAAAEMQQPADDGEGEVREGESDATALRRLRQALARARVEKTKTAQAGQREVVTLQHEVQQLRLKLRGHTAAKASREHELEATIKRLSRRSQLHESVAELSDQLASAHAAAARQQVTIESLRMEKDHALGEVVRHGRCVLFGGRFD
jgi:colicin import membrane protein